MTERPGRRPQCTTKHDDTVENSLKAQSTHDIAIRTTAVTERPEDVPAVAQYLSGSTSAHEPNNTSATTGTLSAPSKTHTHPRFLLYRNRRVSGPACAWCPPWLIHCSCFFFVLLKEKHMVVTTFLCTLSYVKEKHACTLFNVPVKFGPRAVQEPSRVIYGQWITKCTQVWIHNLFTFHVSGWSVHTQDGHGLAPISVRQIPCTCSCETQ